MVRIRLKRTGTRNLPCYRVVVVDQRSSRDGKTIEEIGFYDPKHDTERLDVERYDHWISKGAQPSGTAADIARRAKNPEVEAKKRAEKEAQLAEVAKKKAEEEAKAAAEAKKAAEEAEKAKKAEEAKAAEKSEEVAEEAAEEKKDAEEAKPEETAEENKEADKNDDADGKGD